MTTAPTVVGRSRIVLTIDPGETIVVETVNHMTPVIRSADELHARGSPLCRQREETGPIYVRGAKPGDALSARIERIDLVGLPHAHGGQRSRHGSARHAQHGHER